MSAAALSAFGLALTTTVDLPGEWAPAGAPDLPLRLEPATRAAIDARWSGTAATGWTGRSDGARFEALVGRDGDLLMTHRTLTAWLAPGGATLLAAGDLASPAVLRPLLDSVLFTVSLWRGRDALHAGAVVTDAGVIAVAGPSGAGKSSLIAALIDDGARFYTDDILVIGDAGVFPGPPLMTVPDGVAGGGDTLAQLPGERWVTRSPQPGPVRLAGVVALESQTRPPWAILLGGLLRFPTDERAQARRANLALRLADEVPVHTYAPHSASPRKLAQRVNGSIRPGYARTWR